MERLRIMQVEVDLQSIGEHIIKILLFSKKILKEQIFKGR
jgi:hypothetical protein